MKVYRIEYKTYQYSRDYLTAFESDWFPAPAGQPKYVKARCTRMAIATLRASCRDAIEISSIDLICKLDIEQQEPDAQAE